MTADLESLGQAVLGAAKRAGAEAADVVLSRGAAVSVDVRDGKLEQAEREESTDIGLRVLIGGQQASIAVSDARPETIAAMAERAVAMARVAPEDPTAGLADPGDLATDRDMSRLDLNDPAPDPNPADLQDAAARAEAAAMAVEGVDQVSAAAASFSRDEIHLAATNGFAGGTTRSRQSVSVVAISGAGLEMERDYAAEGRIHGADMPPPEEIGALAGARAVAMKGARKPPTGAFPVIYDERVSSGIVGHLLSAVNGAAIARGASWLRDAEGAQVLPRGIYVTEDPHRARIPGSRLFDAEGLATAPRDIVADGVLTGWTLDLATARKLGLQSTANAARGTASPPSPSHSNIALTQGAMDRDALIRETGTGLLITSLIGMTVSATTGDYSRGASGFWIEGGEIAYPVNECTIAGNLRDMLMTLTAANDARAHLSHVVPSLRIEGLTIAGA